MKTNPVLMFVVGCLLGAAVVFAYLLASGGWYQYELLLTSADFWEVRETTGWEPVVGTARDWVRRPRFRLEVPEMPRLPWAPTPSATPPPTPPPPKP